MSIKIGERLKEIRLEKGISLDDTHRKTKIQLNILKAIEEDQFAYMNPVYLKGFIKIYCKFLGVDAATFTPEVKETKKETTTKEHTNTLVVPSKPSTSLAEFNFQIPWDQVKFFGRIAVIVFAGWLLFVFVVKAAQGIKQNFTKKSKKKTTHAAVLNSAVPKNPENAPISAKSVSGAARLTIRAREDCWISLKADGRTVFQNILRKGRLESWQAKEKIEFALGNAGVVDVEVNGKLIPTLGRKGQVMKNMIVTKEGIEFTR